MSNTGQILFDFIPLYHSRISSRITWQSGDESLNRTQERALMIIGKAQTILPSHLGKCLDMKPGSLTTLLDALEEKGLASRHPSPEDRRKIWIRLTPAGQSWVDHHRRWVENQIRALLNGLSDEDRDALELHIQGASRILEKL